MSKAKSKTALAHLSFARQYHSAAEQLFDQRDKLRHPVYFLYFHTVELALKAFLFSVDAPKCLGHGLTNLYDACYDEGLRVGVDDPSQIRSLVSLLESGNRSQGFRYITQESRSLPDFTWTREAATELLGAVANHLKVDLTQPQVSGPAVRLEIVMSKPTPGKYRFAFGKPKSEMAKQKR